MTNAPQSHPTNGEPPLAVRSAELRRGALEDGPQLDSRQPAPWLRGIELLLRTAPPVVLLTAGVIVFLTLSTERENESSPPAETQALPTHVEELHVGDYQVVVRTHGVVKPHNEVVLSAEVSGPVSRINSGFEVGAYFSQGDVLLELAESDYLNALAIAEAQHRIAHSALKLAELNHRRSERLVEQKVVTEAEAEQAAAARDQAAAELESSAAQVDQAKRNLERTKIRAPFDGRVRRRDVGVGQFVAFGSPLGVLFDVEFAEVRLPIAGTELSFLELPEHAGDPPVDVEFRDAVDSDSETTWVGRIVRTEGALDADSLELFAIARIDDPFGLESGRPPLRIEQPVSAAIGGRVLRAVTAIPRGAVRQLDRIHLVDQTNQTLIHRTIDPLWTDEDHVVVRDPTITDGDWLATTHLVYAPEGAKVEILPDVDLTATASTSDGADQAAE